MRAFLFLASALNALAAIPHPSELEGSSKQNSICVAFQNKVTPYEDHKYFVNDSTLTRLQKGHALTPSFQKAVPEIREQIDAFEAAKDLLRQQKVNQVKLNIEEQIKKYQKIQTMNLPDFSFYKTNDYLSTRFSAYTLNKFFNYVREMDRTLKLDPTQAIDALTNSFYFKLLNDSVQSRSLILGDIQTLKERVTSQAAKNLLNACSEKASALTAKFNGHLDRLTKRRENSSKNLSLGLYGFQIQKKELMEISEEFFSLHGEILNWGKVLRKKLGN